MYVHMAYVTIRMHARTHTYVQTHKPAHTQ